MMIIVSDFYKDEAKAVEKAGLKDEMNTIYLNTVVNLRKSISSHL